MRRLSLLLTTWFLIITLSSCGKILFTDATEISTEAPTVASVKLAPPLSELSAELKTEIEVAWQKQFEKTLKWSENIDDYEFDTIRYYGTHQGIPVLFQSKNTNLPMSGSVTVAGNEMEWGSPFQIYVYKEGVFIALYSAHSRGYLSDDDVRHIAAIHEYFVLAQYGSGL